MGQEISRVSIWMGNGCDVKMTCFWHQTFIWKKRNIIVYSNI